MDNGERVSDYSREDEIPVDIIMDDLEAHFDDIDGRLTISRMVSDPVVDGMVIAVEQEAAERIAKKESVRTDHFHRRLSTDHLSPSALEGDGNGEDSRNNKPDNLDSVSLKHLSREELMTHYNSEITKMRRNYESQVQQMTEENFRLKRELRRERGSSSPMKQDKEFDMRRENIPHFISKLDNILFGNEKVHLFNGSKSLSTLKDRVESLDSRNHRLRDTLMDKKKELRSISSQLSDAVEKLSQQQLTEKNLLQRIQKLECDIGDSDAEFSIIQDVYKCLFEEILGEFRRIVEESVIRLGLLELIFKETLINAEDKLRSLNAEYVNENHIRVSLEMESIKNKEALRLEAAEKEKLKQEMLMLMSELEEKDKEVQAVTEAVVVEIRKMGLASGNLAEALKEVDQYKEKMYKLHQNLEQRTKELREIDEERKVFRALTQEKQDALTQIEAREMETRKQMGSTIVLARELLTAVSGFESRVNKDISRNCSRVESMISVFHCLIKKANILKTNGLLYKQRLETSCSNLEKAEVEVDLLADEVNTLLSFLEEIYKKLDHYSPILQHYPGITEILELVRRKLIGESRIPA
ncbi:hypothetical protein L6164_033134 [Bauhinia variegata]|uniref:Uncharacterized protein n=1 Tax=Bauhinia variegata TaxID=167791 RepID=A0ACB9KR94_BAUVA|nr:hypothetical protein L6164_033134 [Bauhinia variegata]